MEQILGEKLPSKDLHEALRSGIVLRDLVRGCFGVCGFVCMGSFDSLVIV